jgi:hypothetical protein
VLRFCVHYVIASASSCLLLTYLLSEISLVCFFIGTPLFACRPRVCYEHAFVVAFASAPPTSTLPTFHSMLHSCHSRSFCYYTSVFQRHDSFIHPALRFGRRSSSSYAFLPFDQNPPPLPFIHTLLLFFPLLYIIF